MDYTPRYDRGVSAVNNPGTIADSSQNYRSVQTGFDQTDADVEQHRQLSFYVPDTNFKEFTTFLPPASTATFFARCSRNGTGFDNSFEIVLVAQTFTTAVGVVDPIAVAWIDETAGFQDPRWVFTVTGLRVPTSVWVKSGIFSGSASNFTNSFSLDAYLSNDGAGVGDRINPSFTVPTFDINGNFLFSRNAAGRNRPLKQTAQFQREFFSDLLTFSFGTPTIQVINIFGGPWIGQMSHSVDTATLITEVKGMDAELIGSTNGVSIDTDNSQRGMVQVADPLRYDWLQYTVEATAVSQDAMLRLGLTSPTR